MNVIIKYRARAKYVISYLKFNNPIRKKTIFDEFLYGSYNNSSSSIYEGDIYIPSNPEYTKIVQKSCFSAHSARRAKSLCDFAKGFGPGEYFPVTFIDHQQSSNFSQTRSLNSRSANSHLRDDAFFGTWRGPSTNFVRDSSPGGVRLSGAIRPSSDVIQEVRDPPGGEELGKNTRRALPIF